VLEHDATLIERARTHVGNLAHALKTPLAILQAELARDGAPPAGVVAEQVATMTRLTQHHLARAAAAGPSRAAATRTALAPVARALATTLAKLHAERRLAIDVGMADGVIEVGDRQDREGVVGTRADNAGKWARRRVRLSAQRADGRIAVVIDDDGPGMGEERADEARARGVRLDPAMPGSGLGLSIAADLVEIYGGSLQLLPSPLGGLRARIDLAAAT
jgi:signal transduction histidine kinase